MTVAAVKPPDRNLREQGSTIVEGSSDRLTFASTTPYSGARRSGPRRAASWGHDT